MPNPGRRSRSSNRQRTNSAGSRTSSASSRRRNTGTSSRTPRLSQSTNLRSTPVSAGGRLTRQRAEAQQSRTADDSRSATTLRTSTLTLPALQQSGRDPASGRRLRPGTQGLQPTDSGTTLTAPLPRIGTPGIARQQRPGLIREMAGQYRNLISEVATREKGIKDIDKKEIKDARDKSQEATLKRELALLQFQKAELARLLSDQWYRENFGDGEFNEQLVLQQFSYNWFSMKDQLAYTEGDTESEDYIKQLAAMDRMLEFRQKEVDQLLDQAKSEIESETGKKVDAIAVGSVSPTSDYDITFEMKGRPDLEQLAVRRFNALFLQKFGVPSGVMFDTNVYTTGFMPTDGSQPKNLEYKDKMMNLPSERNLPAVVRGKVEKHFTQLALSLLPIRQHLQDDRQWSDFLVGAQEEMRFHLLPNIDPADRQAVLNVIDSGLARLFLQVENLDQETKFQLQKEIASIKRTQPLPPEVTRDATALAMHLEALAKDRLYEKTLVRVSDRLAKLKENAAQLEKENNRGRREQLLNIRADLITSFEKEQGKALVYANEAYFSGGAAVHVVKGLQAGGDFRLGKQQKLQSLLMNIGYKLQHFSHQQAENGVERAIIGTSKYGQRVNNLVSRSDPNEVAMKGLISLPTRRLLDDEDLAITNFKKNDGDLPTPTDKEKSAIQLTRGKDPQQYAREVEGSFLEVARNAFGPYMLTKYRDQKKRNPKEVGRFNTFWS